MSFMLVLLFLYGLNGIGHHHILHNIKTQTSFQQISQLDIETSFPNSILGSVIMNENSWFCRDYDDFRFEVL